MGHSLNMGIAAGCAALLAAGCMGIEHPEDKGGDILPVATLTSHPNIPGAAGCWLVDEDGRPGALTLRQAGDSLYGYLAYDDGTGAAVNGRARNERVVLRLDHLGTGSRPIKRYELGVSSDGRTLASAEGQPRVELDWSPCKAGCWSLAQGRRQGTLTLTITGERLSGFADWQDREDGVVTGTVKGEQVDMRIDYPGSKRPKAGIYKVTLAPARLSSLSGTAHEEGAPEASIPVFGESVPCKDLSGCFHVAQRGPGGQRNYGLLRIQADPAGTITGTINWEKQQNPTLRDAVLASRTLRYRLDYPRMGGVVENHAVVVDASGDYLTGGSRRIPGDTATVLGSRSLCRVP